ncbi:MAG: hypothetical protein ACLGIO_00065 [Acidimicrobiia bacterium]
MTTGRWSIDEDWDRTRASDGHSRYGAYLDARLHELLEGRQVRPEEWVAWCWQVATPPVMSPGYAAWSDPIESTSCWRSDADGRLVATVVVRVPASGLVARLPRPWAGWSRGGGGLTEPRRADFTALASVTLEGPLTGEWPAAPADLFDRVDRRSLVAAAKAAVGCVLDALDRDFGPAVEALRVSEATRA